MSIGFDGKQFFLREDNGRRINLLSIADTFANRSSASLYQNLVPGYGELEKNEEPLTVALLKLLSEKGRLSAEPEAALCILIFQALTRNGIHMPREFCAWEAQQEICSQRCFRRVCRYSIWGYSSLWAQIFRIGFLRQDMCSPSIRVWSIFFFLRRQRISCSLMPAA